MTINQKSKPAKARNASSESAKSPRKIAPEDLLKFELVSDPQISPDGSSVLFTHKHVGEKNNYVTNLWIIETRGGQARQFTSGGKESHGRWSPDGQSIAFISRRDEKRPQIDIIPATGGEALTLTHFPQGSLRTFKWSPNAEWLAVAFRETDAEWTEEAKQKREETGGSTPPRVIDELYYRLDGDGYFNNQRFHLSTVDVATGAAELLFNRDTLGWFDFDWSPDSSELVVSANTSRDALLKSWKTDLFRVNLKTRKARKIPNLPAGVKGAVCWSPDGKQIAYVGREGKEVWGVKNTRLYVCHPDRGRARDLTGDQDYCLSAITLSDTAEAAFDEKILWSPDSRRILMNFGWQGQSHVSSIDAEGGKVIFHTKGRQSVAMGNLSGDGSQLALTVGSQMELAEVGFGRFTKPVVKGALRISKGTGLNKPLLDKLERAPAEPHWISSASGTKVHVWVIKPPGFKPGKKYPAVLEIHGGPHCQYGEAFFHEFQVLAAAGYVVVYSNPRGSKGYGEAHCAAIKGRWGHADWEDVQAVIRFMKEQPYINPKRMGVTGGSYGGYMTNWIIGHTHDFAAAITDRCVSNLVSMVGSSDLPLVPGEYWDGNSWDQTEEIWAQSPLKYFGHVKTPTLIIHSEGDLRCNVEQAEQVFAALKLRRIPTRFVRYPAHTSHGLSRNGPPDLRLHRLGQILDWWKRYLR